MNGGGLINFDDVNVAVDGFWSDRRGQFLICRLYHTSAVKLIMFSYMGLLKTKWQNVSDKMVQVAEFENQPAPVCKTDAKILLI